MQRTIPVRLTDDVIEKIDALRVKETLTGMTRSQFLREVILEGIGSREKKK